MTLNKFTVQKSFAISAGAGSGKTYTLSRRYINALLGFDYFREDYDTQKSYFEDLKNAKVNQIVTITYTEAAALEMKGRIFELVSKIINSNLSINDSDYNSIVQANNNLNDIQKKYVQKTLNKAYQDSSNAKISTIHSFCLDIIKSNSDIAKIDTKLDIIKDDERQKELISIIFDVLNNIKNKEVVLDISSDISMYFINNLIDKYVSNSKFRNNFDNFDKNSIDVNLYKKLILELYPLPLVTDEIIDEIKTAKDSDIRLKWFNEYINNFKKFNAKAWGTFTIDAVIKSGVNKGKECQAKLGLGIKTYPNLVPFIDIYEKYIEAYSYIDSSKETLFFEKIKQIKILLNQIKSNYDNKLKELNKIDFDTIITKTLEIIPKITTNFKYIMVDEFQDTNEVQFEIVKNACGKDTNLFVVGDSKQSIYSFQGAEIEVFNDAIARKDLFYSIEDMSVNYRSDKVVLDTVNTIFKELFKPNDSLNIVKQNFEAQAQDLKTNKKAGSFNYLITSQAYQEDMNELDNIAQFIYEISKDIHKRYTHISKHIKNKEKAIAIIFDSNTKMLELKQKLNEKGITAKISASDNYYHTKEVNDIYNVLKALDILSKKELEDISKQESYYVLGAMRSNILRYSDNDIKEYINTNTIPNKINEYINTIQNNTLSQTVKYIYDNSNLFGVYTHFNDLEQRVSNLYKFLDLCVEYEQSDNSNLYMFLSLLENAIYFSQAKEPEAFYKSDNTKSIEICSIHSTKGLAYPLVLLANSEKGLYNAITSESLKYNNITINNQKKEIVGFKINDYIPLSHRVLKSIDKLKHLAEKKRLLYVALTRAEHDVIISAKLNQKKEGDISLREDSYLNMICSSLDISKDELYGQNDKYCITLLNTKENLNILKKITYESNILKPLEFGIQIKQSATSNNIDNTIDDTASVLGTVTHKIIELYWNNFNNNQDAILDKMLILDESQRKIIINNMNSFYKSDIYNLLKNGVEHKFELEFNINEKIGFIDFIYFDKDKNGWIIIDFKTGTKTTEKEIKYQEQLNFYTQVMFELNYTVVDAKLLWLK